MVRHIGVLAIGAKVPHKQAHGIAAVVNLAIGPMAAMLGCDQMFVGPCGVGIAHHNVGGHEATVLQLHAHGFVVLNADRRDGRVVMNGNTAAFQQTHQALHDGAGAAHGRMHTPGALQRIDQGIGTGD